MVSKKKIIVAAVTAVALSIGVAGTASAHGNGGKGNGLSSILSDLVKKGTLTQAQVDAINAAKTTAESAMRAAHDAERAALEALVAKTIGVDAAVIKTRLAAGESLGAIAGAKKDALIAVLVADETKRIDAAVTAGKLTAAQATTMKAGLVAHVTAEVNSVGGPKGGPGMGGPKGGRGHGGPGMGGHGMGDNDGDHGPKGGMTPPPAGTTLGKTASYKA
jgi:Spy/CpxP family protein refolding chaperone